MFGEGGPSLFELAVQALSSTERGYDLLAPKFDRTPFRTPDEALAAMAKVIGPARRALDVCCGTGAALVHLEPLASERLVGMDFSRGMLDEARRRLSPRVELVQRAIESMEYDAEFDVVTCAGAFGHVVDEEDFLRRVRRALVPGGRFVFPTGPRPSPRDAWFWMAHGFNAVMRARNALLKPEFVMYYLTFLWPEIRPTLERAGFRVAAHEGLVGAPFERVVIVVATREPFQTQRRL